MPISPSSHSDFARILTDSEFRSDRTYGMFASHWSLCFIRVPSSL